MSGAPPARSLLGGDRAEEFLQKDYPDTRVQIFATDVSETAIEYARAGVYPASIEADVSDERLRLFFTRVDGSYRVNKMVRDLCVFARQDLTKDPPFSHLDLVLCRNVLIYLDAQLQRKLLTVFHYALKPGGFLMLGQAETSARKAPCSPCRQEAAHPPQEGRPGGPTMTFPVDHASAGLPRDRARDRDDRRRDGAPGEVSRVILDRYAPPGVVVDTDRRSSSSAARPGRSSSRRRARPA